MKVRDATGLLLETLVRQFGERDERPAKLIHHADVATQDTSRPATPDCSYRTSPA